MILCYWACHEKSGPPIFDSPYIEIFGPPGTKIIEIFGAPLKYLFPLLVFILKAFCTV